MSVASDRKAASAKPDHRTSSSNKLRAADALWIHGRWPDLVLFIATPLLIIPLVGLARLRLSIEQVGMYVTAFGAMGHHLPGMLRAYGDRDLFRRFRTRFLLAPVLLVGVALLFALYDLDGLVLVAVLWATWHAWMQVYGFLRIYDSKCGSFDAFTARLDLLMCAGWFVAGVLFSPTRLGQLLSDFYKCGGPVIPPGAVHAVQWGWGILTGLITVAFVVNLIARRRRDETVSRLKLLTLATSVGFWWYAMIGVNNAILGVAMFEVFHDVQYLAIVWQFNRRRAATTPASGAFTRFLFRGGGVMLGLYLGLVFAYGALGLLPRVIDVDVVNRVLGALFVTSGLLHFYYDGFIWKVRERATRDGLGLSSGAESPARLSRGAVHALKWTPFVIAVVWFGWAQARGVPSAAERLQHVVDAVPAAWQTQLELGVEWLKADDPERAVPPFAAAVQQAPLHADAHYRLGNALARLGRDEAAAASLTRATKLDPQLTDAHVDLAVLLERRNLPHLAEKHYRQALATDPQHVQALSNLGTLLSARGDPENATALFEKVLAQEPQNVESLVNLAAIRLRQQRPDDALPLLNRAIEIDPQHIQARRNLGVCYAQLGRWQLANREYRVVLVQQPDSVPVLNSLAWNLATMRDPNSGAGDESVVLAERAAELTSRRDLNVLQTLAAAYAASGRFDEAVATAEHVAREARSLGNQPFAAQVEQQLARYRSQKSLRAE